MDNGYALPSAASALSAMSIDDRTTTSSEDAEKEAIRRRGRINSIAEAGAGDAAADYETVGQQQQQQLRASSQSPGVGGEMYGHGGHDQHLSSASSSAAQQQQLQQQQQQQQMQLPIITPEDLPPDMLEAFNQLDPEQQRQALEMLAQQQLEQQQAEEARPEEHFLTMALNGELFV